MSIESLILPLDYTTPLGILDTEIAIKLIKDTFERSLAKKLSLTRVSAPLFVDSGSGLNDDLNGVERAVSFDIKETGTYMQIVHSLAKWKRLALKRYGFNKDTGLYTDMNAIRRDEDLDNLHSVYVDQWDWEKIIDSSQRNLDTLKEAVTLIMQALKESELAFHKQFSSVTPYLQEEVFFITSQELEDLYPSLLPKEREDAICREKKTVFIMQIGGKLKSGRRHDGRAPDYDDWQLNGDLLIWYPILNRSVELTSMGIRVDEKSLDKQLTLAKCDNRRELSFHKQLLAGELPLTMGGGIGQSRLCMLILQKAHIGEVHSSFWSDEMVEVCQAHSITLL